MHIIAVGTATATALPKHEAEKNRVRIPPSRDSDLKKPTYIAPYWCRIIGIRIPDDGVDEVDQTSYAVPNHKKACSSIPG
jgi:hypothetical protein